MRYGLSDEQLKKISAILSKHPAIEKALLFGSRAMGNYKKASDVDIAVVGKGINFLQTASIKNDLEKTNIPFFFDVLSYDNLNSQEVRENIDEYGKVIYRKI